MFRTVSKYQRLIFIIAVVILLTGLISMYFTNTPSPKTQFVMSLVIFGFTYFIPIFICWGNQLNLALHKKKRSKTLERFLLFIFILNLIGIVRCTTSLFLGDFSATIALAGTTGMLAGASWCIHKINLENQPLHPIPSPSKNKPFSKFKYHTKTRDR